AHSLSDLLNQDPFSKPTSYEGLFDVSEPDSKHAFEVFKQKHEAEFRLLFDTSTNLDSEDIDHILSLVIPGLDEIMGLKIIIDHLSTAQYEKIIVDTAPTGHALRLLSTPHILDEWIKVMAAMRWKYRFIQRTFKGKVDKDDADDLLLDLKRMVSRTKKILTDTEACEFILVTLPDLMNLKETKRLLGSLQVSGIGVRNLIINKKSPGSIDPFYEQIRLAEQEVLERELANFNSLSIVEVPRLITTIDSQEYIKQLSFLLFNQKTNGA
ncbi:MAG: ArsA family ATPase, partial [Bacteroidota bacterium]